MSRRRQFVWLSVVGLVLASLVVGWWAVRATSTDRTAAESADRHRSAVRQDIRTIEARRASTLRTIAALEATLRARTADRDALAVSLFSVTGQLNEAQATLAFETSGLQALNARVGALRGCLQGVSGALNALAVGDTGTAITRLRAVGSDCDAAS
jgi:septal ring factor EnvC (AmiA/AmiB activator)